VVVSTDQDGNKIENVNDVVKSLEERTAEEKATLIKSLTILGVLVLVIVVIIVLKLI